MSRDNVRAIGKNSSKQAMRIVSYHTGVIGKPEDETEQVKVRKRIKRNMQKKSRRKNRKR